MIERRSKGANAWLCQVVLPPLVLAGLELLLQPVGWLELPVTVEEQPVAVLLVWPILHRVMSTCWPPFSRPLQYFASPGYCSSAAGRHS